jgi:hypothetical protein
MVIEVVVNSAEKPSKQARSSSRISDIGRI